MRKRFEKEPLVKDLFSCQDRLTKKETDNEVPHHKMWRREKAMLKLDSSQTADQNPSKIELGNNKGSGMDNLFNLAGLGPIYTNRSTKMLFKFKDLM